MGGTVRIHLLLKSGSTTRFYEVSVLSSCPKDSRECPPMSLVFRGNNGSVSGFPRQIVNFIARLNDIQHMASQQPTISNTHGWCTLEYFISQSRHSLTPKKTKTNRGFAQTHQWYDVCTMTRLLHSHALGYACSSQTVISSDVSEQPIS